MNRILVIRFSSMGDVLLTAPVLKGALDANPLLNIDLVTKRQFSGYFSGIERLKVIPADTESLHKGFFGLMRLSREINKAAKPDVIIDLHEVIRSRVLRYFFALQGIPVYRIDKGRREKRAYIKVRNKKILKHTTQRYLDVFKKVGIEATMANFPFIQKTDNKPSKQSKGIRIGLAPFARHKTKAWPLDNMISLMALLSHKQKISFYFYGSKADASVLKEINFGDLNVDILAGTLSPQEEITSISELDLFVSMDSANMHLADLLGVPVISIWGATHPDLGFRPLNQPENHAIQSSESLPCRPCSVYGNKPCILKDAKHKCLITISPEIAAAKILSSLS